MEFTDLPVKLDSFKVLLREGGQRRLQELRFSLYCRCEQEQARDSLARAGAWAAFASASLADKAKPAYAFIRGDLPPAFLSSQEGGQ